MLARSENKFFGGFKCFAPTVRITRVRPSDKPDAVKQRRSRAQRRRGFESFRLYLPTKVREAVRVRENLPQDAKVTRRMVERAATEGIIAWADTWLRVKRGHQ
jgi:hypothetical protein